MALDKQGNFSQQPSELPDVPSPSMTPDQIRAKWQTPLDEFKTTFNNTIDKLNSTTDGASGADNVGATGFDGTPSTTQALLENLNTNKATKGADWTGTWQGYTPSKADPGISSVVERHTAQLADLVTYNALNVRAPFGTSLTSPKGDGVTDDTATLQAFLDYKKGNTTYVPDGTYLISSPLKTNNDSNLILSNGAIIKAIAPMDFLFKYNDDSTNRTDAMDTWSQHVFIKGGQLDGNYQATNILGLDYYLGFTLEDTKFLNCSGYALKTRLASPSYAHELKATNLYFRNTQSTQGATAIYNNAKDAIFSNIIIRDFQTQIWTTDGLFSKVHGWIGFGDLLANSRFIISDGTYAIVDQCYADSFQYSFVSRDGVLAVSNSTVINNPNLYTPALQSSNPVVIFQREDSVLYPGQSGYFVTSGNTIHSMFNISAVGMYDYRNSFGNDAFQGHNGSVIDTSNYQHYSTPTYQSIFTDTASYVTRAGRIVDLSIYGSVTSATANTWTTIATLPSEYIPYKNRAIMMNGTDLQVLIKTDGTIQVLSSTTITISTPLRFTDTYIVNSISH